MTAARRKNRPLARLWERVRTPIEPPAGFLEGAGGSLRLEPERLRDVLDALVAGARTLEGHGDPTIRDEATDLLVAVSLALGARGEARDLAFIHVGQAIERLAVQSSDVARLLSGRIASTTKLKKHRGTRQRNPETTARIVATARKCRLSFAEHELVGAVYSRLGNGREPGTSESAIRRTLQDEGILPRRPPVRKKSRR